MQKATDLSIEEFEGFLSLWNGEINCNGTKRTDGNCDQLCRLFDITNNLQDSEIDSPIFQCRVPEAIDLVASIEQIEQAQWSPFAPETSVSEIHCYPKSLVTETLKSDTERCSMYKYLSHKDYNDIEDSSILELFDNFEMVNDLESNGFDKTYDTNDHFNLHSKTDFQSCDPVTHKLTLQNTSSREHQANSVFKACTADGILGQTTNPMNDKKKFLTETFLHPHVGEKLSTTLMVTSEPPIADRDGFTQQYTFNDKNTASANHINTNSCTYLPTKTAYTNEAIQPLKKVATLTAQPLGKSARGSPFYAAVLPFANPLYPFTQEKQMDNDILIRRPAESLKNGSFSKPHLVEQKVLSQTQTEDVSVGSLGAKRHSHALNKSLTFQPSDQLNHCPPIKHMSNICDEISFQRPAQKLMLTRDHQTNFQGDTFLNSHSQKSSNLELVKDYIEHNSYFQQRPFDNLSFAKEQALDSGREIHFSKEKSDFENSTRATNLNTTGRFNMKSTPYMVGKRDCLVPVSSKELGKLMVRDLLSLSGNKSVKTNLENFEDLRTNLMLVNHYKQKRLRRENKTFHTFHRIE
ncbi:hypothetical protein ElyMa_004841800 [Elysia marginata]|uniref:Uncharacterized protein n=1 Tax=Elysia marginata TaxID=1093978 RepID=A0AAV4INQ9_9GAST|nr:hypothetical protein ElyMa_004841800 [Elysia marginata]